MRPEQSRHLKSMQFANFRYLPNLIGNRLHTLPLVILYITDGCNSRCAMCDIWKSPRRNMDMQLIAGLVESCQKLHTQMVLLSGGEAMQHPEWQKIAEYFRAAGIKVWLLTNGLFLRKQAADVMALINHVTVSLDAATPELYHQIRGVDSLPLVLEGMQAVSSAGVPLSTRTTLMRVNFRQIGQIVDVALANGAKRVSFLAVDTTNEFAFGPRFGQEQIIPLYNTDPSPFGGLTPDDLPEFAAVLDNLEATHAAHFADGRIAESPAKLRRLYNYFAAPHHIADFTPPRCNAPHISVVVNVDGRLQPCYFLPHGANLHKQQLEDVLNEAALVEMRTDYRQGKRHECERCVCPLYRGPRSLLKGF